MTTDKQTQNLSDMDKQIAIMQGNNVIASERGNPNSPPATPLATTSGGDKGGGITTQTPQQIKIAETRETVKKQLVEYKDAYAKVLPAHIDLEKFLQMSLFAIKSSDTLSQCTVKSILGAIFRAAYFGLIPNTPSGECSIVPRWNYKLNCWEASYQNGYTGLEKFAYQSGLVLGIRAYTVYENDHFKFGLGTAGNEFVEYIPAPDHTGKKVIWYWAKAVLKNGYEPFAVISPQQALEHAKKYSDAYKKDLSKGTKSSKWTTDMDGMAEKTVIIKLLKHLPREISGAIRYENTINNFDPKDKNEAFDIDTAIEVSYDDTYTEYSIEE